MATVSPAPSTVGPAAGQHNRSSRDSDFASPSPMSPATLQHSGKKVLAVVKLVIWISVTRPQLVGWTRGQTVQGENADRWTSSAIRSDFQPAKNSIPFAAARQHCGSSWVQPSRRQWHPSLVPAAVDAMLDPIPKPALRRTARWDFRLLYLHERPSVRFSSAGSFGNWVAHLRDSGSKRTGRS